MQSLTRYGLLLENVLKRTPKDHDDNKYLVCVVPVRVPILRRLQSIVQLAEKMTRLAAIMSRSIWCVCFSWFVSNPITNNPCPIPPVQRETALPRMSSICQFVNDRVHAMQNVWQLRNIQLAMTTSHVCTLCYSDQCTPSLLHRHPFFRGGRGGVGTPCWGQKMYVWSQRTSVRPPPASHAWQPNMNSTPAADLPKMMEARTFY
jgi:hypothetical protein